MPKLVLTRALPSAGKTTRARAWVAEDPINRVRINRDDTRMMIFGDYVPGADREETITVAQDAQIFAMLSGGKDVIVDDTNLNSRFFKAKLRLAQKAGAEVEVMDIETPLETCLTWNETREKRVDPDVIRSFASRYLRGGRLPPVPTLDDAAPAFAPYEPDVTKPRAWICDLDGTIAKMQGRGPFEWHRVGEDLVNEPVRELVRSLRERDDVSIIMLSGRDGSCRPQTEEWLSRHGIDYDHLFMRAPGDMRKDSIVKAEIFDRELRDRYWVVGSLDDRDQVVKLWRDAGIFCAQVDYGNF
jgi:predicted kinase